MEWTIRPARPGDAEAIAALEADCFASRRGAAWIAGALPDFLTAVSGEELLGYADMSAVLDEGYMGDLAVAPRCRRQGLGRALMEALLRRGKERGLAFLTLEVRRSNTPARALYESLGFRTVGERRDYYAHPREDAVLMTYFFDKEEEETC